MNNDILGQPGNLNTTIVDKESLLSSLKKNLEAHNEVYSASLQAYYEILRAELREKVVKVTAFAEYLSKSAEDPVKLDSKEYTASVPIYYLSATKPTSHARDYELAISKATYSLQTSFALSDADFKRFILNEWDWADEFVGLATTYLNSSSHAVSGLLGTGLAKFAGRHA